MERGKGRGFVSESFSNISFWELSPVKWAISSTAQQNILCSALLGQILSPALSLSLSLSTPPPSRSNSHTFAFFPDMEYFLDFYFTILEFLFTLGLSILISFVIAKFLLTVSSSHAAAAKSVSVSVTGEVEETLCENKYREKSVLWGAEGGGRVSFLDEAVEFNGRSEESRVETVGSPLAGDDYELVGDGKLMEEVENKVSDETVSVEETKGPVSEEEKGTAGHVEFEENFPDELSQTPILLKLAIEPEDMAEKRFRQIHIEPIRDEMSAAKSKMTRVVELEYGKGRVVGETADYDNNGSEDELFGDWEGIESTELEKRFGAAVVFVGSKSNADRTSSIDRDTKMRLYGLHKIATEGHCLAPQPMVLKVSARAKWIWKLPHVITKAIWLCCARNAWQQLGNMNREVAMEQYISLLSNCIPDWMGDNTENVKQASSDSGASSDLPNSQKEPGTANESLSEDMKHHDDQSGMIAVESSN